MSERTVTVEYWIPVTGATRQLRYTTDEPREEAVDTAVEMVPNHAVIERTDVDPREVSQ